ncbi:hypothetical protein [Planococcus dechangensis]|uniref:Uncharacterized protein n=1 Tax=Planococcus dechangensis TaxID=1176255 RepID=A0ABV9MA52_9BACL
MKHNAHIHMKNWITELRGYGVNFGPGGQALEEMSYYDIRSLILIEHYRRDIEVKANVKA